MREAILGLTDSCGAMDQVIVSMLSTSDASPEELKQLEKIIAQSRRRKERQNRQKKEP